MLVHVSKLMGTTYENRMVTYSTETHSGNHYFLPSQSSRYKLPSANKESYHKLAKVVFKPCAYVTLSGHFEGLINGGAYICVAYKWNKKTVPKQTIAVHVYVD